MLVYLQVQANSMGWALSWFLGKVKKSSNINTYFDSENVLKMSDIDWNLIYDFCQLNQIIFPKLEMWMASASGNIINLL